MKKKIFLVLFFSGIFYAEAQHPYVRSEQFVELFTHQQNKPFLSKGPTSLVQLWDSIYSWSWDTLSGNWSVIPYVKMINIFYDANYNLTSLTYQRQDSSAWVNEVLVSNTYDANDNLASELFQTWFANSWWNYIQRIYTYDSNNNVTSKLEQHWSSAWFDFELATYTYDSNNNLTNVLTQHWNGSSWDNVEQYIYTYDSNNNRTSFEDYEWNGASWDIFMSETYTYDANNNLISSFYYNSFSGSIQYAYTYDTFNRLVSKLGQRWTGTWVNFILTTNSYDASDNLINTLTQFWVASTWVNYSVGTNSFDNDNFRESSAYRQFNNTGNTVTWGDSTHYYFHTAVGINNLEASDNSITIYPNPSSGTFQIRTGNGQIDNVEVYNVMGEKVFTQTTVSEKTHISLTNQPSGIYFVRVRSKERQYIGRVSILR